MSRPSLSPQAVKRIFGSLPSQGKVFLVGGQALNVWAGRYADTPGLDAFAPFTSKDIDFCGDARTANELRAALGGEIDIPSTDDHSPEAARVRARFGDEDVTIDFMASVKGVDLKIAEQRHVTLELMTEDGESLSFNVSHPLDVFRSRIANTVSLGRRDDHSLRQLGAATLILGAYIDHLLSEGLMKGAVSALTEVHDFLLKAIEARGVRVLSPVDPIEILRRFTNDERLDVRYRTITLEQMISRLERKA